MSGVRKSKLKRPRRSSEGNEQPLGTQVTKGGFDGMFPEWPTNKQKKVWLGNRLGYAPSWPSSHVNSLSVFGSGTKGHPLSETGISGSTGSPYGSTGGFLNTATNVNSASNYNTSSLAEYIPTENSLPRSYVPHQDIPVKVYQDAAHAEGGIPPASRPQHNQVTPSHMHQNYNTVPLLAQQELLSRSFPAVASSVDTQHRVAQSRQTIMGGDRQNVYLQCSETSIPAAVRHEQPPTAGATGRDGLAAAASSPQQRRTSAALRHPAGHEEMSIPAHLDFHLDDFL